MPNVRLSFTCCSEEQEKGLDQGLKLHLLHHKLTFTFESSCASAGSAGSEEVQVDTTERTVIV